VANTKQAKKRVRQANKSRVHNMSMRSMMRTSLKKVTQSIEAGKQEDAKAAYQHACAIVDRYANKGLIHKNKAARHKSALNGHLKKLAA
jgi:small subunit ribosomal protein S20